MPDADLTCLDFWCRGGSTFEDHGEEGLAHFLEHMVFKGSATLQAGEFDRRIEALGGSSNAATGFDDVHFHVLVPSSCAQNALDLLLDLVLNPALREDAYGMERDVVLEEIAQYRDQPDEQVFQTLSVSGFWTAPLWPSNSWLGTEFARQHSRGDAPISQQEVSRSQLLFGHQWRCDIEPVGADSLEPPRRARSQS